MNIEMALKSRSYILDFDHVKLSLGIFFLLDCLMESLLHQLSGCTFFCQKHTPKSCKFNVLQWQWFLGGSLEGNLNYFVCS